MLQGKKNSDICAKSALQSCGIVNIGPPAASLPTERAFTMSDLTALQGRARRLTLSLRDGIGKLERAENGSVGQSSSLARELQSQLAELQRTSIEMDGIWRMQVVRESAAKRDVWKRTVEQVAEETDSLKVALDRYKLRSHRRQVEEEQRAELLARRTGTADSWAASMDEEAQLSGHVERSKRALQEAFDTGTNILSNMVGQRERLKSAQRKVLDVLNSVGLSDSLLRIIERRQKMDKRLTYGGMVVVLLFLVAMFWWLS